MHDPAERASTVRTAQHSLTLLPRVEEFLQVYWATVGTFNANPSSVALANELNVFVYDRAFVERVDTLFQLDRSRSKKMTAEDLDARGATHKLRDYGALQAMKALDFLTGPRPPRDSHP